MKILTILSAVTALFVGSQAFGYDYVNVQNTPDVKVVNVPGVEVTNDELKVSNSADELVLIGTQSKKKLIQRADVYCPQRVAKVIGTGLAIDSVVSMGGKSYLGEIVELKLTDGRNISFHQGIGCLAIAYPGTN